MNSAWISVLGSVLVAVCTLAGVIYQSNKNNDRMTAQLDKNQAITDTKLQILTDEVKKHNAFAERIPVIEEKIKVINNRIDDLEKGA